MKVQTTRVREIKNNTIQSNPHFCKDCSAFLDGRCRELDMPTNENDSCGEWSKKEK